MRDQHRTRGRRVPERCGCRRRNHGDAARASTFEPLFSLDVWLPRDAGVVKHVAVVQWFFGLDHVLVVL